MTNKKTAARPGRPLASSAGDVEARLLDAATKLFLTLGFEATSCEQVVSLAGAGKGSLYARFANKEELFTAVVERIVARSVRNTLDDYSRLSLSERLRRVGLEILDHSLKPETIAIMRLIIATADRFPELAQKVDKIGWDGGVERVAKVITARAKDTPENFERAKMAAAKFISLTFAPQQMRALLGASSQSLEKAAIVRVDEAIEMLTRSGWLNDWD